MFIVSYDFSSDYKRAKFAKFLKQFGDKIQYSVYKIKNSPRLLKLVLAEVNKRYVKEFDKTDNILIFYLCDACIKKIKKYGSAIHEEEDVVYLE
jgi:CRISPR-associated protein Cas2